MYATRLLWGKAYESGWINSLPDSCGWMKLGDTAVALCCVAKQSTVKRNNNVDLSGVPFFQLGSSSSFSPAMLLEAFSGTRTNTISGIALLDLFTS